MTKLFLQFLIFFFAMLAISLSGHLYLYKKVFQQNGVKIPRKYFPFLFLLVLSPPLAQLLFRLSPSVTAVPSILLTWMGYALLAVLIFLGLDTLKVIWKSVERFKKGADRIASPERRLFLQKGATFGALFSAGGLTAHGMNEAYHEPRIEPVDVPLKRWKKGSLRILQISDLHVGPSIRREFVEKVAAAAMAQKPDLIALTGDFVDGSPEALKEHIEPLKALNAPLGVFFVTGNHEYYSGADLWIEQFSSYGWRVLRNENIRLEHGGQPFVLAGVDDWGASKRFEGHGADHEKALKNKDHGLPAVLLSHQPKGFYEAAPYGIDLQLSGHTHGGQIWPFAYIVPLVQPYVRGLHFDRHRLNPEAPESAIYVSRGTGFWGPAIRLDSPSEVTLLTIRPG